MESILHVDDHLFPYSSPIHASAITSWDAIVGRRSIPSESISTWIWRLIASLLSSSTIMPSSTSDTRVTTALSIMAAKSYNITTNSVIRTLPLGVAHVLCDIVCTYNGITNVRSSLCNCSSSPATAEWSGASAAISESQSSSNLFFEDMSTLPSVITVSTIIDTNDTRQYTITRGNTLVTITIDQVSLSTSYDEVNHTTVNDNDVLTSSAFGDFYKDVRTSGRCAAPVPTTYSVTNQIYRNVSVGVTTNNGLVTDW
jgi:hypothetical protein